MGRLPAHQIGNAPIFGLPKTNGLLITDLLQHIKVSATFASWVVRAFGPEFEYLTNNRNGARIFVLGLNVSPMVALSWQSELVIRYAKLRIHKKPIGVRRCE